MTAAGRYNRAMTTTSGDQSAAQGLLVGLKAEAARLGFSMLGLVPVAREVTPRPSRLAAYLRWISAEMHGTMGYMARPDRVARRQDPRIILPEVQTVICVGLDYATTPLPEALASDPARGRISNYAWRRDYHDVMTPRLEGLGDWLAANSAESVRSRAYVDTGAVLERAFAEQAGLGFVGKNTMLIGPQRGSYFFLGELLTTVPLAQEIEGGARPSCGTCTRCLSACPTDAFPRPYVLDARRCISYLTIELKGAIPLALRPQLGNWVYGCDVCQAVCPFNRFALDSAESAFTPATIDQQAPPLLDLLTLDEAGFGERFADSPIARIGRERLVRNACVAAGNWGSDSAEGPLRALLTDPSELIREHATWALQQIET